MSFGTKLIIISLIRFTFLLTLLGLLLLIGRLLEAPFKPYNIFLTGIALDWLIENLYLAKNTNLELI